MIRTSIDRRRGPWRAAVAAALVVAVVACQERSPTALDDSQLPDEPLTLEVELPWAQYGSGFQVLGGYGSASNLPITMVTRAYIGALEARTLMRFDTFPVGVRVVQDGVTVTDTDVTYVAAFLSIGFDTVRSVTPGPVALEIGGMQEEWHARSASWSFAVDTVADQRAWAGGGGAVVPTSSSATWDPAFADSVIFPLDSATIATWIDPADRTRGANLLTTTDGTLLVLNRASLRVSIRSSLADSIVEDTIGLLERTIIYDPPPTAPAAMRIGGVPAWRSLIEVAVPQLNGPPELCAAVGCPYTLEAGQVSYAALKLTTRATESAFQPFDTVRVDARPVLSAAALPKSPLGNSETLGLGRAVPPEAFGAAPGLSVEVPITTFMRTLLSGPGASGNPPPSTLAILTAAEPSALSLASFDGPGDVAEPLLRMVITVGRAQVLP